MSVKPRTVTPIIAWIRDFLNGRKLDTVHRFESFNISNRTQPLPNLPVGPSHKLSTNLYYERDGRRFCQPPAIAYDAKAIAASSEAAATATPSGQVPKPGAGFNWETGGRLY